MSTKQIAITVSGELYDEMMRVKQEFSFPSLADFVCYPKRRLASRSQ